MVQFANFEKILKELFIGFGHILEKSFIGLDFVVFHFFHLIDLSQNFVQNQEIPIHPIHTELIEKPNIHCLEK